MVAENVMGQTLRLRGAETSGIDAVHGLQRHELANVLGQRICSAVRAV